MRLVGAAVAGKRQRPELPLSDQLLVGRAGPSSASMKERGAEGGALPPAPSQLAMGGGPASSWIVPCAGDLPP